MSAESQRSAREGGEGGALCGGKEMWPHKVRKDCVEQVTFELNLDGWVGLCQLEREEITCVSTL